MRLTVHDHAMIHALHVLADPPWVATDAASETAMVLSILRETMPGVARGAAPLAPLAEQADRLLCRRDTVSGLQHEVRLACHNWNRHRLAAAWDSIKGKT